MENEEVNETVDVIDKLKEFFTEVVCGLATDLSYDIANVYVIDLSGNLCFRVYCNMKEESVDFDIIEKEEGKGIEITVDYVRNILKRIAKLINFTYTTDELELLENSEFKTRFSEYLENLFHKYKLAISSGLARLRFKLFNEELNKEIEHALVSIWYSEIMDRLKMFGASIIEDYSDEEKFYIKFTHNEYTFNIFSSSIYEGKEFGWIIIGSELSCIDLFKFFEIYQPEEHCTHNLCVVVNFSDEVSIPIEEAYEETYYPSRSSIDKILMEYLGIRKLVETEIKPIVLTKVIKVLNEKINYAQLKTLEKLIIET